MMMHEFDLPSQPTNSTLFRGTFGWDLYVRNDKMVVAGDCTREQAQAALSQNVADAEAAEAARIAELEAQEAARVSARARLRAQGFSDAEIDVMYPSLAVPIIVA